MTLNFHWPSTPSLCQPPALDCASISAIGYQRLNRIALAFALTTLGMVSASHAMTEDADRILTVKDADAQSPTK